VAAYRILSLRSWQAVVFIVAFNAIVMMVIYAVDLAIVLTRKFKTRMAIAETVIHG
jgi:hypothetical protein